MGKKYLGDRKQERERERERGGGGGVSAELIVKA